MRRREFLRLAAASGAIFSLPALLAACGGDDEDSPGASAPETSRSTRELRVATNVFPVSLDPDVRLYVVFINGCWLRRGPDADYT